MTPLHTVLLTGIAVSAAGAVTDARAAVIPNQLTFGALVAAPIAHCAWGLFHGGVRGGLMAGATSMAGAIVCGLVPYLLFRLGGMFGGDVKLLAALGAICGPLLGIEAEFYAFASAAIFALGRFAWDGSLLRVLGDTTALAINPLRPAAQSARSRTR